MVDSSSEGIMVGFETSFDGSMQEPIVDLLDNVLICHAHMANLTWGLLKRWRMIAVSLPLKSLSSCGKDSSSNQRRVVDKKYLPCPGRYIIMEVN